MKLLLDSHAYVWWLIDDPRLSSAARGAIADPSNVVFVSAATVWELAIKASIGGLEANDVDLASEIVENAFGELVVTAAHGAAAAALPSHHADPFDRMLIAQAQAEGAVCVTRDRAFDAYEVATLW